MDPRSFLFGEGPSVKNEWVPNYTPEQMQTFNTMGAYLQGRQGQSPAINQYYNKYKGFLQNYDQWATKMPNQIFTPENSRRYYEETVMPYMNTEVLPAVGEKYGNNYWGSARVGEANNLMAGVRGQYDQSIVGSEDARSKAIESLLGDSPNQSLQYANWEDYYKNAYNQEVLDYLKARPYSLHSYMKQGKAGMAPSILGAIGSIWGGAGGAMAGYAAGTAMSNAWGKKGNAEGEV